MRALFIGLAIWAIDRVIAAREPRQREAWASAAIGYGQIALGQQVSGDVPPYVGHIEGYSTEAQA